MSEQDNIIAFALEAGLMLSTAYGQNEGKLMPVSDSATLRKFADLVASQYKASLERAQTKVKKYSAYREACEQYIGLARLYLSKGDPDKAYGFLKELCAKLDVVDGDKPTTETEVSP